MHKGVTKVLKLDECSYIYCLTLVGIIQTFTLYFYLVIHNLQFEDDNIFIYYQENKV